MVLVKALASIGPFVQLFAVEITRTNGRRTVPWLAARPQAGCRHFRRGRKRNELRRFFQTCYSHEGPQERLQAISLSRSACRRNLPRSLRHPDRSRQDRSHGSVHHAHDSGLEVAVPFSAGISASPRSRCSWPNPTPSTRTCSFAS